MWNEENTIGSIGNGVTYPAASQACLEDDTYCSPEAVAHLDRDNLQLSELATNSDGQTLYAPFAFRGPDGVEVYDNCSRDTPEYCPSMDLSYAYDYTNINDRH